MAEKTAISDKDIDGLLKSMLVFVRTVDHVVETCAVSAAAAKALSNSKVQILRLLTQRSRQTSTQIARFLGVSKPAVSQIVDSMVHDKLVTRRGAKEDRREVILELTKLGKDQAKAIRKAQRQVARNMVRNAGGRSVSTWINMLSDMASGLAKADKAYEEFCMQCGAHEDGSCVLTGGNSECLFLEGEQKRRTKKTGSRTSKAGNRRASA